MVYRRKGPGKNRTYFFFLTLNKKKKKKNEKAWLKRSEGDLYREKKK